LTNENPRSVLNNSENPEL